MAKGLLDRLLEDGRRAQEVQALLAARFGADVAQIDEVVKSGGDSVVMAGQFGQAPAIFKQFLTADAAEIITRMQAELRVLNTHLDSGPYRANAVLAALPKAGLVVLTRAPGQRVSLILKSDRPDRQPVLRLCAGWLARVAPLRSEPRKLGPKRLARQFADLDLSGMLAEDRALITRVMQATQDFGQQIQGMQAVHAVAHGDFAPVNMVSDGRAVWAVDIQGATWFPLARIVARFLVAKDLYSDRAAPRDWGLDADDLYDFAPQNVLPPAELTTTLPYFIGQQLVRRYVSSYPDRGGHPAARTRLSQFLTTLESRCL